MSRSTITILVFILLIGLLFALDVYATYSVFTSRYPGANDFYSRWRGAQVYWRQGIDPYSDEATLAIQRGIYGRPARPNEDPGPFAYPFYTVLLLFPLVWLPYPWVQAIWMVTLEFSLIGGVLLYLWLVNWRPSGLALGVTALWSVLFYHSARTIVLGQFAGLVFLWTVGVLWALDRRRDILAGLLLALTTIKPQMSVLLIPALLLWGIGRRRWRFLGSFGVTMTAFLGLSFIMLPTWLVEFIDQVVKYPSYTAIGSPVWVITHHYLPQLGLGLGESIIAAAEVGLSALLLIYLLVEWRNLPRAKANSGMFHWLVGLTLIVTNLIVLRTATTNFVILYIPLVFALKVGADRLRRKDLMLSLFNLLTIVGMWALFLATVEEKFEHPIMYLPLPVGLLLAFFGARLAMQGIPDVWE